MLQGEREMAMYNKSLGKFQLTGIPPAPRGIPQIEVGFDIDANGIVKVSAKDLGTGKEQKIEIKSGSGLSDDEIKRMVSDAESHADEDKKARELAEARNQGESAAYNAEKQLKELAEQIDSASKTEIEDAIKDVNEAVKGNDAEDIRAKTERLQTAFHKVSEAMYERAQSQQQAEEPSTNGASTDGALRRGGGRRRRGRRRAEVMTHEGTHSDVAAEEEFSAAAPPHPGAAGAGETSFGDAEAPPASELQIAREKARRLPRAGPAHPGRLRELPQADGARERGGGRSRDGEAGQGAAAGARPPRARAEGGRGSRGRREGLRDGRATSCRPRSRASASRRSRRNGEPFDPNEHEAMAAQPREGAESGTVVEVYQSGYRINGAVLRPARVVVAAVAMARAPTTTRPSGSTRRPPRRRSRRRTASSRGSTTPTRTRTPGPRSASRRSPRPTTSWATRTSARSTTAAARSSAAAIPFGGGGAGGGGSGRASAGSRDILQRHLQHRPRGAARARSRRPSAARTSRRRSRCRSSRRSTGAQVPVSVATHAACTTCRGTRRPARHVAQGLPGLQRPRRRGPGPGRVLDHPPVLALQRLGHRDRGAVRDVRAARAGCAR